MVLVQPLNWFWEELTPESQRRKTEMSADNLSWDVNDGTHGQWTEQPEVLSATQTYKNTKTQANVAGYN